MKKYLSFILLALMFCIVISAGCGGSSDSDYADPEQTENLNDDTGSYDSNEEGRGTTGTVTIDLSTLNANYTAQNGEPLIGTLGKNVKISIAKGATINLMNATINGVDNTNCQWAGLTCAGDATIILEGVNTVKGFFHNNPVSTSQRAKH